MKFRDSYYFLSNMSPSPVRILLNGIEYQFSCAEAAFQAAKCPQRATEFVGLDGFAAKKLGRTVQLIPNWNQMRVDVMRVIVNAKFQQNPQLIPQLCSVQDEIVEDNTWGDTFWGRCNGTGENHLGRILMEIRSTYLTPTQLNIESDKATQTPEQNTTKEESESHMLIICRTCNRKVFQDIPGAYIVKANENGEGLLASKELKSDRASRKRAGEWTRSYYDDAWTKAYLNELKNNPEKRSFLNVIFRQLKTQDVCLVFSESESWATSSRKIIAGLFLGAGMKPEQLSTGHELTAEDVQEMASIYSAYSSL